MKRLTRTSFKTGLAVFLTTVFIYAGVGYALDVQLVPGDVQREVGGKVRVHIIATDVSDLISFGVKVGFNACVLEVDSVNTAKNTDFDTGFVMDPDGIAGGTQYTDPTVEVEAETCTDTFANGAVTMIGGRLIGDSTTGLDAPVLLGWITFNAIAEGESNLTFDMARYHPSHPTETYDNFVGLGGPPAPVYDSTIPDYTTLPAQRGTVCVVTNACYADVDGDNDVDNTDALDFRDAFPSNFPSSSYNPAADSDGDGDVDNTDALRFRNGFPRTDCPTSCP